MRVTSVPPLSSTLLHFCTTPSGELMRPTDETEPPRPDRSEYLRRQIVQMLRAQAAGLARMSEATTVLVEEGLLAQVTGTAGSSSEWDSAPEELDTETVGVAANLSAVSTSFLALRLLGVLKFSALHRRETRARRSDADSLRELLGRNEALKRQTFLIHDDMLEF